MNWQKILNPVTDYLRAQAVESKADVKNKKRNPNRGKKQKDETGFL